MGEKNYEKKAKKVKGVFAKVKISPKKIVLINATIFDFCIFSQTPPYSKNVALKSEKRNIAHFPSFYKGILKQNWTN